MRCIMTANMFFHNNQNIVHLCDFSIAMVERFKYARAIIIVSHWYNQWYRWMSSVGAKDSLKQPHPRLALHLFCFAPLINHFIIKVCALIQVNVYVCRWVHLCNLGCGVRDVNIIEYSYFMFITISLSFWICYQKIIFDNIMLNNKNYIFT